jgi:hypothetical protein
MDKPLAYIASRLPPPSRFYRGHRLARSFSPAASWIAASAPDWKTRSRAGLGTAQYR